MTLKDFLDRKRGNTKVRVIYEHRGPEYDDSLEDNIRNKPHLIDVVSWETVFDNYGIVVVIKVV